MDDAPLMDVLQSIAQLQKKCHGVRRIQWPGFQQHLAQAWSIHKIHREIWEIARQSELVNANYIPMIKSCQRSGLTCKTVINAAATIDGLWRHDFQQIGRAHV